MPVGSVKTRRGGFLLPTALAVLTGLGPPALASSGHAPGAPLGRMESIGAGVEAPEASGILISGSAPASVMALRGRVLVVEFWASWCGPCIEALPRLDALRREMHAAGYGDRFEVLAVGLDKRVEDARRFLGSRPVGYPVVVDTIGIASRSYGVWRMPATFLVDVDGTIKQIYHGYGPTFGADLRQRVIDLLRADAIRRAQSMQGGGAVHPVRRTAP
ncbi:TlpA family protein disulfide reductase [Sinimarinibacterium thermocellulolyticum]|uniref:TlpA disulfide reductase family protein n=1 Tax=Sinimarinibacterium thermocellulolyticum TaxID=3170016 RepID=A0ABV2A9Z5_9GAMM